MQGLLDDISTSGQCGDWEASWEGRGDNQRRTFGFSQLGAGRGVLEGELQTLPPLEGPCPALLCEGHRLWHPSQTALMATVGNASPSNFVCVSSPKCLHHRYGLYLCS